MAPKPFWIKLNAVMDGFRRFPLFQLVYRLPGVPSFYHFCLAFVGAVLYHFPSKKMVVIGVTGTKGKTTTIELINTGLENAGKKTALLSSWRIKLGDNSKPNLLGNTQPGRFYSQYFLREALKRGCQYALLEIGSEGGVRHRHRFIDFDAAVFINIHPEHIESHGSFEKYREAKLSFFRYVSRKSCKTNKRFFINGSDANADLFIKAAGRGKVIICSPTDKKLGAEGKFYRENAGVAEAVLRSFGVSEKQISKTFADFAGVPGRMEFVQKKPFKVVVDYAHTPDSLEIVYRDLRPRSPSKMICVLGCAGGGRDKWKRPRMGEISAHYCDSVILTNEDPFDEDPWQIIKDIEMGIKNQSHLKEGKLELVLDRRQAIKKALSLAKKGDMVVITGKGSEPYLRVKSGEKIAWSDVGVVREILAR